jgi:hypothetical protein
MPAKEHFCVESLSWKGRNLAREIELLRLSDSGAKSAVGAFTKLAQAAIPKMLASRRVAAGLMPRIALRGKEGVKLQ